MRLALLVQCHRVLSRRVACTYPKPLSGVGITTPSLCAIRNRNGFLTTSRPLSSNRVLRAVEGEQLALNSQEETIFALSTAAGKAAIAVIRISGPACVEVEKLMTMTSRSILIVSRYTMLSVPTNHSPNLDMLQSGLCLTRLNLQLEMLS
jgi:hypothetical protein